MLPVSVDGMIWLNTTYSSFYVSLSQFLALYLSFLAFGITIVLGTVAFMDSYTFDDIKTQVFPLYAITLIAGIVMTISIKSIITNKNEFIPEPVSYSVYFEENMDYKTLYENYNIISTEGNIVTIELKEK